MINLFETLQKAQGGQALDAIGRQFAMSPAQVQTAVDALLPAYTVALQYLARNPQLWPSLIAGMAAVAWLAWKAVNRQEEKDAQFRKKLDDDDERASKGRFGPPR